MKSESNKINSLVEFISELEWEFSVTLAFNAAGSSLSPEVCRYKLKGWEARVNEALLGREWARRPGVSGLYVLEKPSTNPHWHGLVRLPTSVSQNGKNDHDFFPGLAISCWKTLVPAGSVDVQEVYDSKGAAKYISKSLNGNVEYCNFVVPGEFSSR